MFHAGGGVSKLEMRTHDAISLGQVNSELNADVLELPVEIDVIAVFPQEIVL